MTVTLEDVGAQPGGSIFRSFLEQAGFDEDGNLNMSGPLYVGDTTGMGNSPELYVKQAWTGTESATNLNNAQFRSTAKGTWTTDHFLYNVQSMVADDSSVNQKTVSGTASNGGLIRITTSTAHGYSTGDRVVVDSVGGTTEANGSWIVTSIDSTHFDLQGSTFTNAWTSGGITTNRAGYAAYLGLVTPSVARGGLVGVNLHADDVAMFFGSNNGTAKATDFFYMGRNTGLATEWDTVGSFDGATTYGLLVNNVVGSGTPVFRGTTYSATGVPEFMGRMSRGTFETPLRTKTSDILARFSGVPFIAASDVATATVSGVTARIDFVASEDQTSAAQGSRIVFYNTATGSNSPAERGRFQGGDGLDLNAGTFSTFQLRFKNNSPVVARNNAGGANVTIFNFNTSDQLEIAGTVKLTGSSLGVFNTAPTTKQTVTGAKGSNAALGSLLTALAAYGLITDSSSA